MIENEGSNQVWVYIKVVGPEGDYTHEKTFVVGDVRDARVRSKAVQAAGELLQRAADIRNRESRSEQREYNRGEPVALDDRSTDQDPGNTDPDEMTAPLDANDDVYSLIRPDSEIRETTQAGETTTETYGH